ncbi:DEKNAAC105100 [Brettanomyces naardenensis]|uniref:Autophagy-related protein 11 n=1 Tax=Brettanomyces naardenensis TaxID=13370 RepID=A0A448YSX7_BRENA|nr:DEKNAAC105100 [Brettanomyces naardenensis]
MSFPRLSLVSSIYPPQTSTPSLDPNSPQTVSIYNALTGAKILAPSYNFPSIEPLKRFITQSFNIPFENLFLLTPFGIKFKISVLIHEEVNQLFVFDRKFFNPSLIKSDNPDEVALSLLRELGKDDLISMIKPMTSPLCDEKLAKIAAELDTQVSADTRSTDLNLGHLRLLLSSMKQNSGWASALVSDFRSTVFDEKFADGSAEREVQNMLTSLNVLIQYINLSFKGLEKQFNALIDEFILLRSHSLHETWETEYNKLQEITIGTVNLSSLLDNSQLSNYASQASSLIAEINASLVRLRTKIESDIMLPKQGLVKEYDYYRLQYVKKNDHEGQKKLVEQYKTDFNSLEEAVSELTMSAKKLPAFEELITTTSGGSTALSATAVKKIRLLIGLYNSQASDLVPRISQLADSMYHSQVSRFSLRRQLQEKLVTSSFVKMVELQLKTLDANKILDKDIRLKLAKLKDFELQLSVVSDLPLVFGVWLIANLGNLKRGLSFKKLIHKSGEVFEMMRFMERESRIRWLKEFTEGLGADRYLKVTEEMKKKFIEDGLIDVKVVPREKGDSIEIAKKYDDDHYSSLNWLLARINGRPSKVGIVEEESKVDVVEEESLLSTFCSNVKVNDVMTYIGSLRNAGADPEIIEQLVKYLKELGVDMNEEKGDMVKAGDGLGTFDSTDQGYMKLMNRYLKSFEVEKKKKESVDSSDDLIRGYENRIRKLENLLHQQTFQQFNEQWSHKPTKLEFNGGESSLAAAAKVIDLPPSHSGEKMEKLQRENERLKKELEEMKSEPLAEEISKLKSEKEDSNLEAEMTKNELEKTRRKMEEIEAQMNVLIEDKRRVMKEKELLGEELAKVQKEHAELKSVNEDLVENLSQKENEFNKESQINQQELNELKLKLEEIEEDQKVTEEGDKKLNGKLNEREELLNKVTILTEDLIGKTNGLSKKMYENLATFCLILEAIGLLIIREEDGLRIKRVKGLRGRKKEILGNSKEDIESSMDVAVLDVVASDIVKESAKTMEWLPELQKEEDADKTMGNFVRSCQGVDDKYDEFVNHTYIDSHFLVEKVFRRFNDVETLARRLQKEKNQMKGEIKSLDSELSHRLAIRNFKIGDLVLFLKTLNAMSGNAVSEKEAGQPWAVFNIGSPNHYLKNPSEQRFIDLSNRDWFVGRIEKIETKVVTEENYDDGSENPFKLAIGFTWHYVEAIEENELATY